MTKKKPTALPDARGVDQFLVELLNTPNRAKSPSARLMFALDATASRETTWSEARRLHATMFDVAAEFQGNLQVQLCYYQGVALFQCSKWLEDALALKKVMAPIRCLGGYTQIEAVLHHAIKETKRAPIKAVVFIGDAVEEDPDRLCHLAGQLGLLNTPLFIFQEGYDASTESVFKQMAKLSAGAWSRFDVHSAGQLETLLRTVAAFAAGGLSVLKNEAATLGICRDLVRQLEKKA
jgi:hypothetical protein